MATQNGALSPVWDDFDRWGPTYPASKLRLIIYTYIYRQLGQLFMMGFDGTSVTPQIRALIEDYYVGSILLTAKNLKCAFGVPINNDLSY